MFFYVVCKLGLVLDDNVKVLSILEIVKVVKSKWEFIEIEVLKFLLVFDKIISELVLFDNMVVVMIVCGEDIFIFKGSMKIERGD